MTESTGMKEEEETEAQGMHLGHVLLFVRVVKKE